MPSSTAVLKAIRAIAESEGEGSRISFQLELNECRPDRVDRLSLDCRGVPLALDILHASHGEIHDRRDTGTPEIVIALPRSFDGTLTLEGELEWLPGRRQKGSRLSQILFPSLLPQPGILGRAPLPELVIENHDGRLGMLLGPRDSRGVAQQVSLFPRHAWPFHQSGHVAVMVDPQLSVGIAHASVIAETIASIMNDLGRTFGMEANSDFLAVATDDDTVPAAGGMVTVAGPGLLGIDTGDVRVLEIVGVPGIASIWWGGAIVSNGFLGVAICQGVALWVALAHVRAAQPPEVVDFFRRKLAQPPRGSSYAAMKSFSSQMAVMLDDAESRGGQVSTLVENLTREYWAHAVSPAVLLEEFERAGYPLSVPSELSHLS